MNESPRPVRGRIAVDRWPTEMPLFVAVVLVALAIWVLLIVSIVGLLYGVFFALFFFVTHLAFVSYLRGSGVRLGPDQFPELHGRIIELARAMDMDPPAAYLMQAGGSLNAFATRFLGRNIMVLYSDLLEACGDNVAARDMIITHELAHLRLGHLRWIWLTLPAQFVPFLGSALSRAREYTCDRYGLAGAGQAAGATLGMAILSAGPKYGPQVNLRAFVGQREDTNTGFMTLGEWFASHPPLSKRIFALDPSLGDARFHPTRGRILALAILALVVVGGGGLTAGAVTVGSRFMGSLQTAGPLGSPSGTLGTMDGRARVEGDFGRISAFIDLRWPTSPPETIDDVRALWQQVNNDDFPWDPFDGFEYGYARTRTGYALWSRGPDAQPGTADDITFRSPAR